MCTAKSYVVDHEEGNTRSEIEKMMEDLPCFDNLKLTFDLCGL